MVLRKTFEGAEEVRVRFQVEEAPASPGNACGVVIFLGKELNLNNSEGAFEVPMTFEEDRGEGIVLNTREVVPEHDGDGILLDNALAKVCLILKLGIRGRNGADDFSEVFQPQAACSV